MASGRGRPPKPLTADDPRHGTNNARKKYGCTCEACVDAARVYARQHRRKSTRPQGRPRKNPDALLVSCWCERTCVWAMPDQVRRGVTDACDDGCLTRYFATTGREAVPA